MCKTTMELVAYIVISCISLAWSHTGFECYCNLNHPEAFIFNCPNNQGYPIAALRIPYPLLSVLMKDVDLQSPYCVPKLANIQPQGSWVPVYIQDQPGYLGYLDKDSGFELKTCPGYMSFNPNTMVKSNLCNHNITNTPGLIVTKPQVMTTQSHKTTKPQVWMPLTRPQSLSTNKLQWIPLTRPGMASKTTVSPWLQITHPKKQWIPVKHSTTRCYGPDVERDIKKKQTVFFHLTRSCPGSGAGADEVTAAVYCSAPLPMNWKPGIKVNGNCNSIKKYTPVSIFNGGLTNGDGTAIFIECTPFGKIKVVRQTCKSSTLEMVEIVSTPDLYVAMW